MGKNIYKNFVLMIFIHDFSNKNNNHKNNLYTFSILKKRDPLNILTIFLIKNRINKLDKNLSEAVLIIQDGTIKL